MPGKTWRRLAVVAAAFVLLLLLDALEALQGLPTLVVVLGVALLTTGRVRAWLEAHERTGLAMLPFMAAALVLLVAFVRGRDLSQAVLLLVTLAVVFDILLIALALIGEGTKRGARGVAEFAALAIAGAVLGLALSLVLFLEVGRLSRASLAGP